MKAMKLRLPNIVGMFSCNLPERRRATGPDSFTQVGDMNIVFFK